MFVQKVSLFEGLKDKHMPSIETHLGLRRGRVRVGGRQPPTMFLKVKLQFFILLLFNTVTVK